MIMVHKLTLTTLCLGHFSGGALATGDFQTLDVLETENVLLECRFTPDQVGPNPTLYWIRSNRYLDDNVAIKGTPLEDDYA